MTISCSLQRELAYAKELHYAKELNKGFQTMLFQLQEQNRILKHNLQLACEKIRELNAG